MPSNELKMMANSYNGCKRNTTNTMQTATTEHDDSTHLRFYSTVNDFNDWDDSRHQIAYDHVLIYRWTQIYNTAQNLILDATRTKGQFNLIEDPTLNQTTHLLWTKAHQMKSQAQHGTLSHTSTTWATPMNYERLQHFRLYLTTLVTQPSLTPAYIFPLLNRTFITQQEIDDEDKVAIGNMAPSTNRATF